MSPRGTAVYVRGSVRHRQNEDYLKTVDGWHEAETHDWDVLTTDGRVLIAD